MNPTAVRGTRQKHAYLVGMRAFHAGVTNCELNGQVMYSFWRRGFQFAKKNPWIKKFKSFKQMIANYLWFEQEVPKYLEGGKNEPAN